MIPEENRIPIERFRIHAAEFLRRIAKGERFLLTRHGKPVALVAAPKDEEILDNRDKLVATFKYVPRPAEGCFLESLTPEQQKAALDYDGPDNFGPKKFQRRRS